ncbi:LuxR family transcriptional regulator [Pseudoxanthomonas sp. JBR18]|uniref:LuxR family transcriptional regulator n=1 Tax=Pseudoxanthomonas sp. JBR18 TaxID=2969308 RepID=UPI0023052F37|nr:LuxR family transcriptional regulator [Pseudoxanthomonas sp. JBR18]WCE06031.1 LuxR family transcriptional regulator [Pseudoxanthomonas sp. JBR18]
MHDTPSSLTLQHLVPAADSITGCITSALEIARAIGFDALIYDFTPVPLTPEGAMISPSFIELRNMPEEMRRLWMEQGLYQQDPVQALALRGSSPFFWSYHAKEASALQASLGDATVAVSTVLQDWRYSRGVTVPLHMPGNRFATLTGLWRDESYAEVEDVRDLSLMRLTYLAHATNDRLLGLFGKDELTPAGMKLSVRERECIALAAQGLSTKQIAARLNRAESTIVLHLQTAARKLGGRNRAHAIARAAHFGYLSS